MQHLVKECKKKIGEDSIAYYSKDGTVYIFENEKKCKQAIAEKDLSHHALFMLREGEIIKSVEVE